MGMRLASSRHLDVVVMAPALTEAGQSQNLKLPPTSHSLPASPIAVPLNGLNNIAVSQLLRNGNLGLFCKVGSTVKKVGCSSEKFDDQCLNNITKGLAEYPNSFSLDNLATLAIASEILKVSEDLHPLSIKNSKPLMRTSAQRGDSIMNNKHMGDQDDNMGLQKSNTGTSLTSLETGNLAKDKNLGSDMDQLLKNLGAAISSGDIGGSGDLSQNVEELLQVIKNMESNTSDPESVNALSHLDGPEHEIFPIGDGNDLAGGLTTFERELFADEDVMNLCVGVNLGDHSLAVEKESKDVVTKERIAEANKKQLELERKCNGMFRRLRKLQARTMGNHVGEELTGLLEQADTLMNECIDNKELLVGGKVSALEANKNSVDQTEPNVEETKSLLSEKNMWKEIKRKGISPSAMSSVVQRLDVVAQKQSSVKARRRLNRYFRSGSNEPLSAPIPRVIPQFEENTRQELLQVSNQLRTQFTMIENCVDSDATASSSDGESCDEMQSFNNHHQLHVTIAKRAAWRWAKDRADVASRWTWLQAQISDLEYRIRQQNEIYKQVRAAKGPIMLFEESVSRNHSVNGFHGILPGASPSKPCDEVADIAMPCRTRPLNRTAFRKRRLLQSAGLHLTSKKAARPSTVACDCNPRSDEYPCMICTGRINPTAGVRSELMTLPERIGLLDSSFHPVLSFRYEGSVEGHLNSLLQCSEWQQKMLRTSLKVLKTNNMRDKEMGMQQQILERLDRRNNKVEQRRKYKTRLKKNILHNALSAKIKRKLTRGRPRGYNTNMSLQRLKRKHTVNIPNQFPSVSQVEYEDNVEDNFAGSSVTGGSVQPSPIPSPVPMGFGMDRDRFAKDVMRRKRENSYDIDNIVIPYSIASATRVERLPYKEIPTPRWRIVEPYEMDVKNNGVARRSSQDNDAEDISDEGIKARHDRCQVEEKKKFMSYMKYPHSVRGRVQRRFDSVAESSGANTPDAMSPINMLDQGTESCTGSPMASPPSTPQPAPLDMDGNICQAVAIRRRTISQSRWFREREELFRSGSPDSAAPEVLPFEPRTFPLTDEMYEEMLKEMPEGHPLPQIVTEPKSLIPTPTKDSDLSEESRPVSPNSTDSTESLLGEGEDPNDPEWTVAEELDPDRERIKNASIKR